MTIQRMPGSAITPGTITITQLESNVATVVSTGGGPKITNIQVTDNAYTVLDDTAVDITGGYITITGTGFVAGCSVIIGSLVATSVSFISSTEVRAQVPAQSAGTYTVYLVNPDGGVGIRVNGLNYSSTPTWSTTSPLPGGVKDSAISIQLVATSNSAVTFSLQAGSTLPAGLTLSSGGLLSGTVSSISVETTYNFTIIATDAENQDTPQAFQITIVIGDPYYRLVTLHLPGTGTNLAQNNTFLDSSSNNFAITRTDNTTQGTFSPFSQTGWGNYFDGTGDYLTVPDNAAFAFGGGAVTIETWAYFNTTISSFVTLLAQSDNVSAAGSSFIFVVDNTGKVNFEFYYGSSTLTLVDPDTVPINQWVHLAVARNASNTISLYVNGNRKATNASFSASVNDSSQAVSLGGRTSGVQPLNGYLSNSRIVKGTAVYDPTLTTLTVPTAPLTAISGTSLLTCQSNRFIDNSTNNFTITKNGDTRVVAFSPFNPTASWSAATNGGSGYFDGTGDYLSVANNAAFNFGSGAFTIEFWYYPTTLSGTQCFITNYGGSTTGFVVQMGGTTAGSGKIDAGFSGDGADITSTNAVQVNSWNHIAISGTPGATGIKLFINGAQEGSTYTGATSLDTSAALLVGEVASVNRLTGYLSGLRLLKGTALYTAAFTPPTAPLTAITNTSLLLNFTNAGIYDATSKNVLETKGDAKISTTQSKFGGSSMLFDGTGDYLDTAGSSANALGSGDWTIEFWLYLNSLSSANIIDYRSASVLSNTLAVNYSSGMQLYVNNSTTAIQGSALSTNTWYHIAVSKSGSSTKMFVNGTQTGSTYTDTNNYVVGATRPRIGAGGDSPSNYLNGHLSDIRITKGYARYTANFTAPTGAFPTL